MTHPSPIAGYRSARLAKRWRPAPLAIACALVLGFTLAPLHLDVATGNLSPSAAWAKDGGAKGNGNGGKSDGKGNSAGNSGSNGNAGGASGSAGNSGKASGSAAARVTAAKRAAARAARATAAMPAAARAAAATTRAAALRETMSALPTLHSRQRQTRPPSIRRVTSSSRRRASLRRRVRPTTRPASRATK
jgi:hypothetical protein